jgi:hypothetical protein
MSQGVSSDMICGPHTAGTIGDRDWHDTKYKDRSLRLSKPNECHWKTAGIVRTTKIERVHIPWGYRSGLRVIKRMGHCMSITIIRLVARCIRV